MNDVKLYIDVQNSAWESSPNILQAEKKKSWEEKQSFLSLPYALFKLMELEIFFKYGHKYFFILHEEVSSLYQQKITSYNFVT